MIGEIVTRAMIEANETSKKRSNTEECWESCGLVRKRHPKHQSFAPSTRG